MINIGEILIANITGIIVLIMSQVSRVTNKNRKHLDDHMYNNMVYIALIAMTAETASFALDGVPGIAVHLLQYLLNAYLFLPVCAVGALWVLYVDTRIYRSTKRLKAWILPIAVPYAIIVTLILCDLFGAGFIFSVTEQNVYHRGSLIIIQYITLLYYYSLSLLVALTAGKQNNLARFFPVHIFVFSCIIGTLIQIFNYGLAVGWLFVSIAFQFIQSYLFNQNSFIDDLTGLYNRKYYNCVTDKLAKSKKQKTIAGVMMDVDQFKSINDELSHSVGDDAIKSIGKLLTEITSRKTMAFRYAGDEFIIISTDVKERDVICMMEAFAAKVESFSNSAGKPYKLSLSMGYALCDTGSFKPNVFLHQMDKKMYEAKTQYYAENNIPRTPHYVTIDLSSTESEG